jgi:hypothetical protein
MAGAKVAAAALTVSVKVWLALPPTPLAAVMVTVVVRLAAGAPLSVAVPSWLSVSITPAGSVPVSLRDGAGLPLAVTVNVPA